VEGKLTLQEKAQALSVTVTSRGWIDVIAPALDQQIEDCIDDWKTGKSAEGLSDEQLKQRVLALEWLKGWTRTAESLANQAHAVENELRRRGVSY